LYSGRLNYDKKRRGAKMTFGQALERFKNNEGKMRRVCWIDGIVLATSMETGKIVLDASGDRLDWIPKSRDLFADDWEVVGGDDGLRLTRCGVEILKLIKMGWEYRDAVDFVTTFME
jgi:hypothetical protein